MQINTKKMKPGQWIDELFEAAKRQAYVHFETRDGVKRSGKLTSLKLRDVKFNGARQQLVEEFELNGDQADMIAFSSLSSIEIE
jgi:hypothetical protein